MRFAKREKAHRHAHKHKKRQQSDADSGAESEAVSRSSTLNTVESGGRKGDLPKIGRLAMTATDETAPSDRRTDSPITPITPASTAGSGSGTPGSGDPSLVDLTTPLISATAAALANQEGVYEEDVQSECSSSCSSDEEDEQADEAESAVKPSGIVSVTGSEPLPTPGSGNIVSERVSTRGRIRPFEPIAEVPALHPELKEHIGQVHPEGAIKKWMAKRKEWDEQYKKDLDRWWAVKRADRERAEAAGYLTRDLGEKDGVKERPPLCALAGWFDREMAREVGKSVDEAAGKVGMGAMVWMRAGGKVCLYHGSPMLGQELTYRPTRSMRVARPSKRSSKQSSKSWTRTLPLRPPLKSSPLPRPRTTGQDPRMARNSARPVAPRSRRQEAGDAARLRGLRLLVLLVERGRTRSGRRRYMCRWRRRGQRRMREPAVGPSGWSSDSCMGERCVFV